MSPEAQLQKKINTNTMSFSKRWQLMVFLCSCCLLLLLSYMAVTLYELSQALKAFQKLPKVQEDSVVLIQQLKTKLDYVITQRNNLSWKANGLMKQLNQLQCTSAGKSAKTSNTGGWCSEAVKTQHLTDDGLIDSLQTFLAGKKVASFGDGPGQYKVQLQGSAASYDAFDGAPFSENITKGVVRHLDLSIPQYGLPVYDWIISLEVAEHIPAEFEAIFLENVARHAREGVILSWAVPGQGGFSHVNNRPLKYVEARMNSLCFQLSPVESDRLKKSSTLSWLQANVNVYRRQLDKRNCEIDASMA